MNKDFNKFYKPKNHLGNELVALNGDGKIDNNFLNIQAPSVSEDLNTIASSEWVDEQIKNATAVLDTDIQNVKTEVANTVLTYSIPFSSLDALKNNYNNLDSVKISELRKCIFLVESTEDKNLYEEYICVNAKDVDTLTPVFTRLGAVETAFATQEIPGSVKLVAEVDSDNFLGWFDEVNTNLSGVTVPTKGFALAPYALKDVYEKIKDVNVANNTNLEVLAALEEELKNDDKAIEEKFNTKIAELHTNIDSINSSITNINTLLGDTSSEDSIIDRLNDLENTIEDNVILEISQTKSNIDELQETVANSVELIDKRVTANEGAIELLKTTQNQQNLTLTEAIANVNTRISVKFEELSDIDEKLTNSYNAFTEEINNKVTDLDEQNNELANEISETSTKVNEVANNVNSVTEKVEKLNDIISYNFYRRETFTNGIVTVARSELLQSAGIEDLDPMKWTVFVNGVITHADYDGNTTFTTQQVYPSVEITRETDSGEILYIISVGETHGTTSRVSYSIVKSIE